MKKTHEEIAAEARKLEDQLGSWQTMVGYTLRDIVRLIAETNEAMAEHASVSYVDGHGVRVGLPEAPSLPKPRRRR